MVVRAWTRGGRLGQQGRARKRTFVIGFHAARLKGQDIRSADVVAELLGHDAVSLGEEAALQSAFDLQHP